MPKRFPAARPIQEDGHQEAAFSRQLRSLVWRQSPPDRIFFPGRLHAGLERVVIFCVQIRRSFTGAQAAALPTASCRSAFFQRGLVFVLRIVADLSNTSLWRLFVERSFQTSGVAEMLQERLVKHGFRVSRSYRRSLLQRVDDVRVGTCGLQKGAEVIVKREGDAARL
jgi:hypothetical protein